MSENQLKSLLRNLWLYENEIRQEHPLFANVVTTIRYTIQNHEPCIPETRLGVAGTKQTE